MPQTPKPAPQAPSQPQPSKPPVRFTDWASL